MIGHCPRCSGSTYYDVELRAVKCLSCGRTEAESLDEREDHRRENEAKQTRIDALKALRRAS